MPTVVIVDISASMLRPADSADPSTTRQDVAQRGILHLLHHLEEYHEFEPVCMLSMSSCCRVLVPFGKKPSASKQLHKELRTSLYGMEAEDTASVTQALNKACALLTDHYGADVKGCQVVLVVDGGPSLSETTELEMAIPRLPRSVVFHIVAMGSEEELRYCEPYKTLAQASRGSFRDVVLPKDISFYKRAFANLASSFYRPYRGNLLCGHLHGPIQLYPDPYLAANLSEQHGGAGEETRPAVAQAAMALRGCIPRDMLLADRANAPLQANFFKIPVASRHVVIPDNSVADAEAADRATNAPGAGSGSVQPLLPVALMNGLRDAGLVAVCHLDASLADVAAAGSEQGAGGHDGGSSRHKRPRGEAAGGGVRQRSIGGGECCFLAPLLMPAAGPAAGSEAGKPSKDTVLQLVMVIPRVNLETGAPKLHKLVTTKFSDIPSLGLGLGQAGADVDALEGKEKKAKRDTAKDDLQTLPDSLQSDLQKLNKRLAELPNKKELVYKESEKLRKCAYLLVLPCVRQAIITLLKSVKADAEGDEARFYIDNLMDQFTREDLSQPIIQATYEPDRQKRGANRASVSNLLG